MSDRPRKAIIIAAGLGRRLSPYTDAMPKCLVPIGDKSILAWQLEAMRAHGVREFVIIRGYLGDVLGERAAAGELGPGIRFVDNREFESNNILISTFYAEAEIDGPVLLTYSDIVFTPAVVGRLMAADVDVGLVIDRDFASIYDGRTDHPLAEGEVSDLFPDGRVRRVGKRSLPPEEAFGEFIGLMKLSAQGAGWFTAAWRELAARYAGRDDQPFQRARAFRQAYLTDLLQELIDRGHPVHPVEIRGQWREIDTVQDFERAHDALAAGLRLDQAD